METIFNLNVIRKKMEEPCKLSQLQALINQEEESLTQEQKQNIYDMVKSHNEDVMSILENSLKQE